MEAIQSDKHIHYFLKQTLSGLLDRPELAGELQEDTQLSDIGVDSIMLVNLMVQIEQHYQIFYEDDELLEENFATIQVISRMIQTKLDAGA